MKLQSSPLPYGVTDHFDETDYHADVALSASGMKILARQTPAHYRHWADSPERRERHFDVGSAAHAWILEGDRSKIQVLDFPDYRSKAAQEARRDAHARHVYPLLSEEWRMVQEMRDQVARTPGASLLLADGPVERSLKWDGVQLDAEGATKTPLRARLDKHIIDSPVGPLIMDLKTTTNADPRRFGKTAADLGHFQQAANYRDGARELTGEEHTFVFVQIEKTPPYLVSVVELAEDAVDEGRRLNAIAVRRFNDCTRSGVWPGYPPSDPVSLPTWAFRELEEIA